MNWQLTMPKDPIRLSLEGKYIIFSDHHRDKYGHKAGNFWYNSELYLHALKYYYRNGYTLIENGDGEDLWQFTLREIFKSYGKIYDQLSQFYKLNRLYLIWGNHNVDMKFPFLHRILTHKLMPGLRYHALLLIGDHIMITHGHQWDWVYRLGFIPVRLIVKFWRYMEILGLPEFDPSIPATNRNKGEKIDRQIISWGMKNGYMMICGHTHKPKFRPEGQLYFNSGSCTAQGYLYGLELINGKISLIEWKEYKTREPRRKIIDSDNLPKNEIELNHIYKKQKNE